MVQLGIRKLCFSKKATVKPIGKGTVGEIYAGRAVLEGGKRKAVAIKLFKTPLTDARAAQYQRTINDLVKAGVRLPRMLMMKLPKGTKFGAGTLLEDRWVQVSQLFGSVKKGSKLSKPLTLEYPTRQIKEQAVQEFTKITNAGYSPVADSIEIIRTKKGLEAIPIDIDYIGLHGIASIDARASRLNQNIVYMAKGPTKEYSELLELAIKTASAELKPWLEKYRLG